MNIQLHLLIKDLTGVAACSWVCTSLPTNVYHTGFFIRSFWTRIILVRILYRYYQPLGPNFRNCPQARIGEFCISASEDRRDFSHTAKWSQWPYLYKRYEATYALKCLVFEKIAKKPISRAASGQKSVFLDFLKK